jgi:hypothetical protein
MYIFKVLPFAPPPPHQPSSYGIPSLSSKQSFLSFWLLFFAVFFVLFLFSLPADEGVLVERISTGAAGGLGQVLWGPGAADTDARHKVLLPGPRGRRSAGTRAVAQVQLRAAVSASVFSFDIMSRGKTPVQFIEAALLSFSSFFFFFC